MLNESDAAVILNLLIPKLTFEKHLHSVSKAASQRLCIMRESWRAFHVRSLHLRCFWGFLLPISAYCSAVWCPAADTHLKIMDFVFSCTCFLTENVFECDIAHRQSVAVLCMLYKVRCNPIHPLDGALPLLYVPVLVTRRALAALRYSYSIPRCRTSQHCRTLFLSKYLCGKIDLVILY